MNKENGQGTTSDADGVFSEENNDQNQQGLEQGGQGFEGGGEGGDGGNAGGDDNTDGGAGGGAAGAAPNPTVGLTAEQLQQLIAGVGQSHQAAAPIQQQQQRQYTQEEFDRVMNVYRPSAAQLRALRNAENEEEALAALNDMLQGASRQAITMAQYGMQAQRQEIEQMINPLRSFYAEAQKERLKTEFYQQHGDLKPYEPFVTALIDSMQARGMKFPTKEAAFKAASEEARKQLKAVPGLNFGKRINPPAGAGAAGAGQNNSQRQSRMSTLSGGGQGGVGGASGKGGTGGKVKGPPGIEVF
jgi:hypothetical protein